MENINIHINKKRSISGQSPIHIETPFDKRSGFFGVVTDVQAKTNTVTVRGDFGRDIAGIRVASSQWVTMADNEGMTKGKDTLTGQRHLPPVNTYVYCLMPTGEPSSAIVLCSVFAYQDPNHADFKEDSEDAVFIEKRIDNGGWKFTHDIRTGTRKIQNAPKDREETISLEVNQEEEGKNKITLKIYGNSFEFDEEEQCVTENIKGNVNLSVEGDLISTVKGDMKATVEGGLSSTVKGDVKITADGNADVEAGGDISIKSSKSGALSIGNVIATLGAMISELLQALISFKSLGSPAAHTAPDLSATAAQIKAKWDQVFK